MTIIEVIDAARVMLGEPLSATRSFPDDTSTFFKDSDLRTYLHLIEKEVQAEMVQTFEDYFVTSTAIAMVNGTAEYTLPTDLIKIRRLEDTTGSAVEIFPVKWSDKGNYYNLLGNSALNPQGYYIKGNQIVLLDTPTVNNASGLKLHYVKRIVEYTSASSISEIPQDHHRVLVWGIVKMALFQEQGDTYQLAAGEFEKHLKRIVGFSEDRQVQRPRRVARTKDF